MFCKFFKFKYPYGLIYKATNLISNKIYIGQTTQKLNTRISQHYRDIKYKNYKFQQALKKYEKKDWKWDIVYILSENDNLNDLEKKYIKEYDSYNNGYNGTLGGFDCRIWKKLPPEQKEISLNKIRGKNSTHSKYVYWIFDNKTNEFLYEIESLSKFCNDNNIYYDNFRAICHNSGKYKNWITIRISYDELELCNKLNKKELYNYRLKRITEHKKYKRKLLCDVNLKWFWKIFKDEKLIYADDTLRYFCEENNINYESFRVQVGHYGHYGYYGDYIVEKILLSKWKLMSKEEQETYIKTIPDFVINKINEIKPNHDKYNYKIFQNNVLIAETTNLKSYCISKQLNYRLFDNDIRRKGRHKSYTIERTLIKKEL